ncbi:hypothetical protein JR316_0003276 [Psilocybe cubensis]|uniref:Uncharacterized protein n=2 Tax=Psilocybe cubensis TaxID=181762 RepID=A0ACB8H9D0_PSICU|nr:hypothetical protein JR316_0003276 [Psilocybe cubensis]KAH9483799.1 hypothetical protein JR316_0003276 [Psilocybe cubensis]
MRHGGTVVPGSCFLPEFLKVRVYLPPAFIAHNPDLHPAICDIVQHFIETVAVRTAEKWSPRAKRTLNYSMTQKGRPVPNPFPSVSIPLPEEGAACYMFFGGPSVHDSIYHSSPPPPIVSISHNRSTSPSPSNSSDMYAVKSLSDSDCTILGLQEDISALQKANEALCIELQAAYDRLHILEKQLIEARTIVPTHVPSTPARAFNTYSGISKTPTHVPKTPTRDVKKVTARRKTPLRSAFETPSHTHASPAPAASLRSPFSGAGSFWVLSPSISTADLFDDPTDSFLMLPVCLEQHNMSSLLPKIQEIAAYHPTEVHFDALVNLGLLNKIAQKIAAIMAIDASVLSKQDLSV